MGAHEIHQLVQHYGCLLVFVMVALQAFCLPVPGTTVLVAAALYAATSHGLPIAGVIAAGALGAMAGTVAGYAAGRWGGERLLLRLGGRFRQSPERVQELRRRFASQGVSLVFIGRFISGLRNVTGLLSGASGMAFGRFLSVSSVAALAWALLNGLEYYFFGHALVGASMWVRVVLIVAGIASLVISLGVIRRRALREMRPAAAAASATADPG